MNSWFDKLHETFIVDNNYKYIIDGFKNTIIITLCALVIGVIGGATYTTLGYQKAVKAAFAAFELLTAEGENE